MSFKECFFTLTLTSKMGKTHVLTVNDSTGFRLELIIDGYINLKSVSTR
jgi:hypothetical protein